MPTKSAILAASRIPLPAGLGLASNVMWAFYSEMDFAHEPDDGDDVLAFREPVRSTSPPGGSF
jgi:hypothetical protein